MLTPSELGTKEHWDKVYERELTNYKEDDSNHGEVWFGTQSVYKMADWVEGNFDSKEIQILSLGCGNGNLLLEMWDRGFLNLHGVDYSKPCILLASSIASTLKRSIKYSVLDILDTQQTDKLENSYDLCLDKGTFDAISLADPSQVSIMAYPGAVARTLRSNGFFLLTSCNWTEAELVSKFSSHFTFHSRVKYPTFQFGGMTGQKVTTIAFIKVN